jgi:uncharacterized protein (UPF0332 family)
MPDIQTHQRQATHNLRTAKYLQEAGETHLDWVATILYYAALHSVDQVLFQNGQINPRNHRQRHASIAQVPELHSIYPLYRELEYQSRRSRYECASFSSEEIQTLSQYVAEIQKTVEALVGE